MSFILSGAGVITDPANAPIDVTRNSAGPYLPGVAYTWNITNLDDYTTYTLTTTNGTIVRSSATLTYTPASSGAGGWTMNGRAINLTIASVSAFISASAVSSTVYLTGANTANATYSLGAWTANTGLGAAYSAVVAQYAPTGTRNWINVFYDSGGTNFFAMQGVKLASDNTAFISIFDSTNNRSYIIKMSTAGNVTWSKYLQNLIVNPGAIAVDSSDNVIFGGRSSGTFTAIAKYNSAGTQQWQYASVAFTDYIQGITTDSSNNIYFVTGDSINCKIVKLNSSGVVQWTTVLSNTTIYGQGIAVDSTGNVYATGYYFLGGSTWYGFVCKLNSSGVLQWQRQVLNQQFYGCAVDSSDNVYASGKNNPGGSPDGYQTVFKWDGTGALQWQRAVYYSSAQTSNNYISIVGSSYYLSNSSFSGSFILGQNRLPTDGSIPSFSIGSGPGSYAASGYTESAGSMTNPAGSLTLAVSAFAETTSTPTNQALTSTVFLKQGA